MSPVNSARSSLTALVEWRALNAQRSFHVRSFTGPRDSTLWQVDLWSMWKRDAVGVEFVSGELSRAVTGALEKAEKERLP